MIRIGWTAGILFCLCGASWAQPPGVEQVAVAVKIVEFQTNNAKESGLSAFFRQREKTNAYGVVTTGKGVITSGDVTFPTSTSQGITVFLDQLTTSYGNFEIVLQALEEQNRASILSRPQALVPVGLDPSTNAPYPPTIIQTIQDVPYEDTVVVGSTTHQITNFRPTGVMLQVEALEVVDDDKNRKTKDDVYIKLRLTARVNEEGQRVTVALDDLLASSASAINRAGNQISVPEFVSREVSTTVWVRSGQTLVLGGLFRSTSNKNLSTLPWLAQGDELLTSTVKRVLPIKMAENPMSSRLGSKRSIQGRRELVFVIKADVWEAWQTLPDASGFRESDTKDKRFSPGEVISNVIEGVTALPQGVVHGIAGKPSKDSVTSNLGAEED